MNRLRPVLDHLVVVIAMGPALLPAGGPVLPEEKAAVKTRTVFPSGIHGTTCCLILQQSLKSPILSC